MLATSENILFPGHNHLQITGMVTLHFSYQPHWCSGDNQSVGWLADGYNLEIGHF